MQIGIVEHNDFSNEVINSLKEIGEVSLYDSKDLKSFVSNKDVIFIRLEHHINSKFLDSAKKLKFLCSPTTGLNHIDLIECKKRNINVLSLKGENEFLKNVRATPEHSIGLIISLLRRYSQVFNLQSLEKYNRELYKGEELSNANVGIIGFGRVGKILSKYLSSFGSNVFFYDVNDNIISDSNATKVGSIEELIDKSKIIILSASYSIMNEGFIDKRIIDMMNNRYFVNIARGELIEENYLLKKIREGFFKGVAIDVIRNETNRIEYSKWMHLDKRLNFIITPHIGGATYDSMHKTEIFIFQKLLLAINNS
jgi:D-3-phosphoglycerate dehydrogenase